MAVCVAGAPGIASRAPTRVAAQAKRRRSAVAVDRLRIGVGSRRVQFASRGNKRGQASNTSSRLQALPLQALSGFAWPAQVVVAVNVYAGLLYALLLSTSLLRWSRVAVRRVKLEVLLLPVCLAYLFLLSASWRPDMVDILFPGSLQAGLEKPFSPQFFPTLPGISHLFSRCEITASSMWLHLLAMNLFAGVHVTRDGLRRSIFTFHSVLLCALSGIAGFFSHELTKRLLNKRGADVQKGDGYTFYKFDDE